MEDQEKSISELTMERDRLRAELDHLHRELVKTSLEKKKSAQYGLVLLDEKIALQQRCRDLETLLDASKHELDSLKETFCKFQSSQKASVTSEIEQEESLLKETAHKEASFVSTLLELEREMKQVKQELAHVKAESDHIHQENQTLSKQIDTSEWEKKSLKSELKEFEIREGRLLSDNNELEEENISLQKQVSQLRSSQVEFEGTKYEVKQLQEEVKTVRSQAEELMLLKQIAEKQLEEAIEALQSEREQKYALKKELNNRVNSESIFNLNNLTLYNFKYGTRNDEERPEEEEDTGEEEVLKQLEADFMEKLASGDFDKIEESQPETVKDLFNEIHLSEIRRLEKQLEEAENEKSLLSVQLGESQEILERTKTELNHQHNRVAKVIDHVRALVTHHRRIEEDERQSGKGNDKVIPELMRLQKLLQKRQKKYQLAVQMVGELQIDVQNLQEQEYATNQHSEESLTELRDEVTKLRKKLQDNMQQLTHAKDDLLVMEEICGESQEDLVAISEELAQLYHYVCVVNGETPRRVILDHAKGSQHIEKDNAQLSQGQNSVETDNKMNILIGTLKTDANTKVFEGGCGKLNTKSNPAVCGQLLKTIHDQVCHLKQAVHKTIGIVNHKLYHLPETDDAVATDMKVQVTELQSQVSTKREQIVTLRTLLKTNKHNAEVALADLKSKYEKEKTVADETMVKLRNELKTLKEGAAMFTSLKAMFTARSEEYISQVEELHRQLYAAEQEKKTLNSLLRRVIHQKLALTQRLENLEMEQESNYMRQQDSRGCMAFQRRRSTGGISRK
ncbi:protein bicaudal D-like [Tachypleus tridentatus]|uniref:protein bicaudal D-like n=1 Tax=Tachypleus tridentatus TaxID=6853 RepID=UPI003FCFDEE4